MPGPTLNWDLVTVRGHWVNYLGDPIEGQIVITPAATRATDATALTTIVGTPFSIALDNQGKISVGLPATDDTDVTPIDFTYHIKEDFDGGQEYDIEVPLAMAAAGIELSVVSPYVVPNPGNPVAVSARVVCVPSGTTGWSVQPDGTLWVEYTP